MKRLLVGSMLIIGLVAVFFSVHTSAQPAPMTEAHIERIKANCVEAQSTLTQLHASDALLRVNRGQVYESISTKLMVPFNNRASVSKLDSTTLATYQTTYDQELAEFRTNYRLYEEAMTKTLRINCTNQPVAFYDSVAEARAKRQRVHENAQALQKTILDYRGAFEALKQKFLQENAS